MIAVGTMIFSILSIARCDLLLVDPLVIQL